MVSVYDSIAGRKLCLHPDGVQIRIDPGWVASAAMILFYVAPLIDLIMPNFTFEDPVSKVYIDIQYGTGHLFTMGITVLLIITVIAAALPLIIRLMAEHTAESDETYEA